MLFSTVHTDEDNLPYVLRLLTDLGMVPKWERIGRVLSVTSTETIKGDKHKEDQLCLLEMLYHWIIEEKRPEPPCGHRLVWAIADKHGGNSFQIARSFASQITGK